MTLGNAPMNFPTSVEQYIGELFSDRQYPSPSEAFFQTVAKLARSRKFSPLRRTRLKKLLATLQNDGLLGEVKLKFKVCRNRYAFMRDSGLVVFDVGTFYAKSGRFVACIVLHELAHLVFSQQEGYAELKRLNEEFLRSVPNVVQAVEMSPIEYYATQCSIAWMEGVLQRHEVVGLAAQVEREKDRLVSAHKVVFGNV